MNEPGDPALQKRVEARDEAEGQVPHRVFAQERRHVL